MTRAAARSRLRRVAVLGAGHVGPVIARAAVAAGHGVAIATSGDPEDIALVTELLIPGAEAAWAAEAVVDSDVVVLAIPLHRFATLDPSLLADKLVVDAMNYWAPVDGVQALFEDAARGSSEIVADRLSRSTVVKTLNHIGYHDLESERRPPGSTQRRAMGVAGDDAGAVDAVADLIEDLGYDAVRLESLPAGRVLQPGGPVFGALLPRAEFELAVGPELVRAARAGLARAETREEGLA
jgi:predicted dinucleotide-binding enzyme